MLSESDRRKAADLLLQAQRERKPVSAARRGRARFAEHEGQLDLDARYAEIGMRHLGAVRQHHVVEQVPVVGFIDLRGALHGLGGESDLVADEPASRGATLTISRWPQAPRCGHTSTGAT